MTTEAELRAMSLVDLRRFSEEIGATDLVERWGNNDYTYDAYIADMVDRAEQWRRRGATDGEQVKYWVLRGGAAKAAELRSAIDVALAELAGEPLPIWRGGWGDLNEIPPGGALLHDEPAVSDRGRIDWYPTVEAAKAELRRMAGSKPLSDDGMVFDYTVPGCHRSRAWVEVRR